MTTFQRKIFVLLFTVVTGAYSGFSQTHEDGLAAMQLENWDKAIKIYSDLTKKDPTDQPAWLTMGSAYLSKGDQEKAKAMFDAAFNAKSEGPYAMIASGRILLLQGKQPEADAIFTKADKYGKKDIVAKRLIGESFLYAPPGVKPNFARAEDGLKKAMDLSSKDYPTLMALAYCYKEMPNGGLAAQHYEYAVNQEPKNPLPVFMLAKVYKAAKLNDKFLTYIDKTLALDPKYTPALRAKAEFLYFEKQWEKATQAAKDLVNNGADVAIEDEMLLANLLYITKDCVGCSDLVEKILKKDPSKNYLRRLQAYCDFENAQYARGLKILESYFQSVTPDKIIASDYEYLGKLQMKTGASLPTAVNNVRKAIEMDSSKWALHKMLGDTLYARKDYCRAATEYQLNLDSIETPAGMDFYRLGLCYYFCTDDSLRYSKAEKAFTKVTELNPDATIGWLWLAKSAKFRDPDIVAHQDSIDQFGVAQPYFEKYAELASKDKEKNKKDLISSYEYLSFFYFTRHQDDKAKVYIANLLELDPTNDTGMKMKEAIENEGATTPTTPVTPPKGGGGGKG